MQHRGGNMKYAHVIKFHTQVRYDVHAAIPAFQLLKQENHKFKASLIYMVSSRTASSTQWDPVLKLKKSNNNDHTQKKSHLNYSRNWDCGDYGREGAESQRHVWCGWVPDLRTTSPLLSLPQTQLIGGVHVLCHSFSTEYQKMFYLFIIIKMFNCFSRDKASKTYVLARR